MTTDFTARNRRPARDCLRLEPETRLVSWFDAAGITEVPVAEPERMGFRVLDDCCQEHIM